ncbi:MAG: hypothetical protein K9M02_14810, partial [Thiohalocapsa sp.]|nr:hypothetical protein [Thiohalocapsa sp.]
MPALLPSSTETAGLRLRGASGETAARAPAGARALIAAARHGRSAASRLILFAALAASLSPAP